MVEQCEWLEFAFGYIFYYPASMSILWMGGALRFFAKCESLGSRAYGEPPQLSPSPPVSILIPCHNEGENVRETMRHLDKNAYPNFEVIAVNDGSIDQTGAILDELREVYPWLRVVHLEKNEGKAMALRAGAVVCDNDILVCIDGDALLDPYATHWFVSQLLSGSRVGAVTGNPRVRTRSTLLGRIQVAEFSCIVGLIKRAQRAYGRVFSVSGVIVAFRREALRRIGYWRTDMRTEDVDVTWRLQKDHWEVRFEPNALCWILMPETLKGLWNQRLRWATGGAEVFLAYAAALVNPKHRRMWPICAEYAASVLWAYAVAVLVLMLFVDLLAPSLGLDVAEALSWSWSGVALASCCIAQFAVGYLVDHRFETGAGRYYYGVVWYPVVYWFIVMATTVCGVPRAVAREHGRKAVWTSPDRGLREMEEG